MLRYPVLEGRHVALEALGSDHIDELLEAAADRTTYAFTNVPADRDAMQSYVTTLLDDHRTGRALPFVQRAVGLDGRPIVGCTRFMDLRYQFARRIADEVVPDEVEIGGTWLSSRVQRTGVNTEAKMLLLRHAFETWRVQRVAICTDERNEQSRRAIERIGARFEGVLRRHRPSTATGEAGLLRNTAAYSVTIDEWPAVESRLVGLLR